jgi:hypothetical protein
MDQLNIVQTALSEPIKLVVAIGSSARDVEPNGAGSVRKLRISQR